jgi:hypothetical protein
MITFGITSDYFLVRRGRDFRPSADLFPDVAGSSSEGDADKTTEQGSNTADQFEQGSSLVGADADTDPRLSHESRPTVRRRLHSKTQPPAAPELPTVSCEQPAPSKLNHYQLLELLVRRSVAVPLHGDQCVSPDTCHQCIVKVCTHNLFATGRVDDVLLQGHAMPVDGGCADLPSTLGARVSGSSWRRATWCVWLFWAVHLPRIALAIALGQR